MFVKFYRPIFIVLILVAFIGGISLSFKLFSKGESALGKVIPSFTGKDLILGGSISDQDLSFPAIINLWASWCPTCRQEHPLLIKLSQQGIPIYGINYQDKTANAIKWLDEEGNPFVRVIEDPYGSLGESMGVYGLPETLLVDENRQIVVQHRGLLTSQVWQEKFLPIWEDLKN